MKMRLSNKNQSLLYQTMYRHATFTICALLKHLKGHSTNRTSSYLILTLLMFASSTSAQRQSAEGKQVKSIRPADNQWRTYTGPDKDFTIDLPAEPTGDEFRSKLSTGETGALIRRYSAVTDTLMFVVSFRDTGYKPGSPFADRLSSDFERKVKESYKEAGWKVVSIKRLSNSVAEVEEWDRISKPSGYAHVIGRTIVRNGQVYDLQCRSTFFRQEVDRDICRRFFDSFRIIGPPQ